MPASENYLQEQLLVAVYKSLMSRKEGDEKQRVTTGGNYERESSSLGRWRLCGRNRIKLP